MENNYDPKTDLKVLLNKPYMAKVFLGIMEDVKKSKTPFYKLATKTGSGAKFGRIGVMENRHKKKQGKWGKS